MRRASQPVGMDLKSGYPFCFADELSKHGHDVVVIEERDVGWGSTAASTALLQCEIDTHLIDLANSSIHPVVVWR